MNILSLSTLENLVKIFVNSYFSDVQPFFCYLGVLPQNMRFIKEIWARGRDVKSEEHEERAPAIFPPAVLIFGLPTQKIC